VRLRSAIAVIAGYAVFAIPAMLLFRVSGLDPHGPPPSTPFVLGSILYGALFALLGGYAAAWTGRRAPVLHGLAVMILIAIVAIISFLAEVGYGAIWTEIATMFLISPFAIAGAAIRGRLAMK
jgi:hypothetical protein